MFKRVIAGVHRHVSEKRLHWRLNEFAGRRNQRGLDTLEQMGAIVRGMDRERLKYKDLTA